MKKIKHTSLTKSTGFLGLISLALILPVTTLTACSTVSQYLVPVITNNNPFVPNASDQSHNIQTSDGNYLTDPYFASGKFVSGDTSTAIGSTNAIAPSTYIYTSAFDNSFTANATNYYGYTNHNAPNWDENWDEEEQLGPWNFNQSSYNDYSYLSYSDSRLDYASGSTLTSYENLIGTTAISTVNATSGNLVTLFNYINNYLVHVIEGCKSAEDFDKTMSILLTNSTNGFDHGQTDRNSEQNKLFYQYYLSNANLLNTNTNVYKFGPYLTDWYIVDSGLEANNTSPFPTVEFEPDLLSIPPPDDKKTSYLIPECKDLIGTYTWNDDDGKFTYNPPAVDNATFSRYNIYSYDDNDQIQDIAGLANIPVLIRFDNLTSAYYNPSKNKSAINPNDWLYANSQLDGINHQISSSGVWKNAIKTAQIDSLSLGSVAYKQTINHPATATSANWLSNFSDQTNPHIDPTILNWYNNQEIQAGDFIGLASYSLLPIEIKYDYTKDGTTVTEHYKTKLPYFNGLNAIFPAYLAFGGDDDYTQINTNHATPQFETYVCDFNEDDHLYKSFSSIISNLTDFAKSFPSEPKPYDSAGDAFNNDPYFILRWLFANDTTSTFTGGSTSSSSDILSSIFN